LTVGVRISAGGAVVADLAGLRLLLKSRPLYEFDLPQGSENTQFKFISTIELGPNGTDDFRPTERLETRMRASQPFRIVDREQTPRLWIERNGGGRVGPTFSSIRNQTSALPVPADWPIHLIGYESAPILTSDDTNVSMNATFLATYAAWFAATTTPLGSQFDEGLVQKIPMWERQWQGMLRAMDTRPRAGSIRAYDY